MKFFKKNDAATPTGKRKKLRMLIGLAAAVIVLCGVGYYALNVYQDKQEQTNQASNQEADETLESFIEEDNGPKEGETVVIQPENAPSSYDEYIAAIENNDDLSEEAKILTYYNAAMFGARVNRPEAKDHAKKAMELIDNATADNPLYETFKPNLQAISEGSYDNVEVPTGQ